MDSRCSWSFPFFPLTSSSSERSTFVCSVVCFLLAVESVNRRGGATVLGAEWHNSWRKKCWLITLDISGLLTAGVRTFRCYFCSLRQSKRVSWFLQSHTCSDERTHGLLNFTNIAQIWLVVFFILFTCKHQLFWAFALSSQCWWCLFSPQYKHTRCTRHRSHALVLEAADWPKSFPCYPNCVCNLKPFICGTISLLYWLQQLATGWQRTNDSIRERTQLAAGEER